MGAAATAIHYRHESMQLFIGMDNGTVSEFIVSDDYNRIDHARDYHAHQSRVTSIHVTSEGWYIFLTYSQRTLAFGGMIIWRYVVIRVKSLQDC